MNILEESKKNMEKTKAPVKPEDVQSTSRSTNRFSQSEMKPSPPPTVIEIDSDASVVNSPAVKPRNAMPKNQPKDSVGVKPKETVSNNELKESSYRNASRPITKHAPPFFSGANEGKKDKVITPFKINKAKVDISDVSHLEGEHLNSELLEKGYENLDKSKFNGQPSDMNDQNNMNSTGTHVTDRNGQVSVGKSDLDIAFTNTMAIQPMSMPAEDTIGLSVSLFVMSKK